LEPCVCCVRTTTLSDRSEALSAAGRTAAGNAPMRVRCRSGRHWHGSGRHWDAGWRDWRCGNTRPVRCQALGDQARP
jgi:hypothetical protein